MAVIAIPTLCTDKYRQYGKDMTVWSKQYHRSNNRQDAGAKRSKIGCSATALGNTYFVRHHRIDETMVVTSLNCQVETVYSRPGPVFIFHLNLPFQEVS